MENNKRIPRSTTVSQIIDQADFIIPERPRKPSTYDYLKQNQPNHRLVVEYDESWKRYEEYQNSITIPVREIQVKPPLKKLVKVDIIDVYRLFKEKYYQVNNEHFNPNANYGESKKLIFSLLYYFFEIDNFFESPLLNKYLNQPNFKKGLLVIGGYGCGKTSIFKALHKLFFDSRIEPYIMVKDINGDSVHLHRYGIFFKYHTSNDVVEKYELVDPKKKEIQLSEFWSEMNNSNTYFDDIMRERQAFNFGKVELFTDIFEKRDSNRVKTFISLNYSEIIDEYGHKRFANTKETLVEFRNRYGPRNYDRIFGNYNIIELTGKSLRE